MLCFRPKIEMKVSKIIGLFLIAGSFLIDLNAQAQKPELVTQTGHDSQVASVAFSPDGTILASAAGDNTIKIWDVASGQELRTLPGHTVPVDSVAFLPNGKFLISVGGSVK